MEWNLFKLGLAVLFMCLWGPSCILGQTRPTASIDLADPTSVNEGTNLAVCVELDMPPSSDATAFISTQDRPTQTAIGGEDYVVLQSFPLTFTTSDTRMCVDLQVLQDGIVERVEGLNVVLTSDAGITVGVPSVEVEIIDTDRVGVAFDPSVITVDEGSVGSICAIITSGTIDRSVSITFNVLENTGTASSPLEYLSLTTETSFTSNITRVCVPVTTFGDILSLVEDDESFEVSLTSQDSVVLPTEPGRVIIRDSNGATVTLQTPTDINTQEGNSGEMMTVNLCASLTNIMGGLDRDIVLRLTTVALTAVAAQDALNCNPQTRGPNDFVALENLLLTFPSNSAVGASMCESVTIVGDNIMENEEMFQVMVTPDDSDDQIAGTPRFTITIASESGDVVQDCGCLLNITNGRVELNPNTLPDSVATYFCNQGHTLIGDATRTCQSGTWSGAEPTCPIDCGPPSSPGPNGAVSAGMTTFGNMATYSCDPGYELRPDNSVRSCQADGLWSGMDPLCEPVDCGDLSDPDNGQVSHPQTTFGSDATYSCDPGHTVIGNSVRMCQADRSWSGDEPVCQMINCTMLMPPSNGRLDINPNTTAPGGFMATYFCDVGYDLVGNSNRVCQMDGSWTGSDPDCAPVDCGELADPANGQVSHPQTTFGSTATYGCNLGYTLNGNSVRTCQANGSWSGTEPDCETVDCGDLTDPDNGQVSHPQTTIGSNAMYSCNFGYTLNGNSVRTCQADGSWSGAEPDCEMVSTPSTTPTQPAPPISEPGGPPLSSGAIGGIAAGAALGALLIIAAVIIIVIVALAVRRSRVYKKWVLPHRPFTHVNNKPAPDNEIRQWESDHQTHVVDAIDALEKDAGGPDDITTESAS